MRTADRSRFTLPSRAGATGRNPACRTALATLFTAITVFFVAGLVAFAVSDAAGSVASVRIVAKQGDAIGESTISAVNTPFTDGNGKVGFVGSMADAQRFIWWDEGPVFLSSEALPGVLTGSESTMGVSDEGGFIYSPSVDGNDAVYTHGGVLLKGTDPVPPLPDLYSTFNSRPTMLPDGTAFWIGGTTATQGGSTSNRHLFRASDPTDPASITRVLGGGDIIDGKMIRTTANNFSYGLSDNGEHHIHLLDMNVTANEHVYLDGAFVAQEGEPTGQGDNWSSFDIVGVNNHGNYIFTGDTDGPTASDEFVAYNGVIMVREGDVVDGVTLAAGFALRAAAINNRDQVAHMWGSGSNEHLFWGHGPELGQSRRVLSVGDSLDVDGDGFPDWVLTDFNASTVVGPGLDLGGDGWIYADVDMVPVEGGTALEAIIGVFVDETAAVNETPAIPVRLVGMTPNPFATGAVLRFATNTSGPVRLAVFDVRGRLVRSLVDGLEGAGVQEHYWDGRDALGTRVPAGAYFVRIESAGAAVSGKLIHLE